LRHVFRARAFVAFVLARVLVTALICTSFAGGTTHATAAALPFAGDDAFLAGPVAVADSSAAVVVVVVIDRAYGALADDAGHLTPSLMGATVSATADFDAAPVDGMMPRFDVAINGIAVPGPWGVVPGQPGVYRLTVPTADLLFPAMGDETRALTPQANAVALSGGTPDAGAGGAEETASLAWLRLTVAGTPPVLLVAGADLACTPPGALPVDETFGDWARWLTATATAPWRTNCHLWRMAMPPCVGCMAPTAPVLRRASRCWGTAWAASWRVRGRRNIPAS